MSQHRIRLNIELQKKVDVCQQILAILAGDFNIVRFQTKSDVKKSKLVLYSLMESLKFLWWKLQAKNYTTHKTILIRYIKPMYIQLYCQFTILSYNIDKESATKNDSIETSMRLL